MTERNNCPETWPAGLRNNGWKTIILCASETCDEERLHGLDPAGWGGRQPVGIPPVHCWRFQRATLALSIGLSSNPNHSQQLMGILVLFTTEH